MSWMNIYWGIRYFIEGGKNDKKKNLLLRFNAKLKGVFGFWPLKMGKIQQFGRTEIPISLGLNHIGL